MTSLVPRPTTIPVALVDDHPHFSFEELCALAGDIHAARNALDAVEAAINAHATPQRVKELTHTVGVPMMHARNFCRMAQVRAK
ncbi:MAG: hypothetical protein EHM35_19215 [Planctomycetaceae bacterium]|nr:MAG: hypothetical protein EHM35_19215 [Planctomycetaceae bacterium]